MSPSEAVRNGLLMGLQNNQKVDPLLYHAQMTMLSVEASRYCKQVKKFAQMKPSPNANAVALALHQPLHDMMLDGLILLEQAAQKIVKVDDFYAAYGKRSEHPIEIINGAKQVIYGTHSGLANADRSPSMAVAVLRTAIELRLRHAFCVYHMVSRTRYPGVNPIDLSTLFKAIQVHEKNIQFDVDINDVWKVYRWSNLYLHAGMRDYSWVPGFVLQYLMPLFGSLSNHVDGGIQMDKAIWNKVRKVVEETYIPETGPRKWKLPAYSEKYAQCIFKNL